MSNLLQITATNLKTEAQVQGLHAVKDEMARRGIEPDGRKGEITHGAAVRWLLENFNDLLETRGGRPATGTGDEVLQRIHDAVTAQIKLNETTDKTVTVGRGKNAVTVKYEQRAITDRWVRDTANANADAVTEYMKEHGEEIAKHNQWLVDSCGYPAEIENFNRRTGKAQARAGE